MAVSKYPQHALANPELLVRELEREKPKPAVIEAVERFTMLFGYRVERAESGEQGVPPISIGPNELSIIKKGPDGYVVAINQLQDVLKGELARQGDQQITLHVPQATNKFIELLDVDLIDEICAILKANRINNRSVISEGEMLIIKSPDVH